LDTPAEDRECGQRGKYELLCVQQQTGVIQVVERITPQQTKPRPRKFNRKHKLPAIVGKGITQIEQDIKQGLLKITRIGPRSVGAYDEDVAEYQRRLQEKYDN
jgi:hypothetical protein